MGIESPEEEKDPLQAEFVRISGELKTFLQPDKAIAVAGRLYTFALDLNNKVKDMADEPEIANHYDYKDGTFFAKDGSLQHRVLDGLAFLRGLDKNALQENFAKSNPMRRLEELKVGVLRELASAEIYLLDREGKLVQRTSRDVSMPKYPKEGSQRQAAPTWDKSPAPPLRPEEIKELEQYEKQMERKKPMS